jgi:hypothetical protein
VTNTIVETYCIKCGMPLTVSFTEEDVRREGDPSGVRPHTYIYGVMLRCHRCDAFMEVTLDVRLHRPDGRAVAGTD